jgi:hypothetical protein
MFAQEFTFIDAYVWGMVIAVIIISVIVLVRNHNSEN